MKEVETGNSSESISPRKQSTRLY
ncbi:hypothetical protein cypCar_00003926 [Cyprinus carpio]|nr:hypothetical protein cypCar_00003926 [Cyprinus carpio]